ncbi:hypothetical protein GALMADRAFT_246350 [Galerina marginata CBS 339.88]|uniref:Uncharacterized protein n=1 Tax=Galerina marginata (strain CBS 339.88) TaxID=685588 RepID=A0A067T463_GALM3|nr:hypothetical protein GALMADRAFT_246350 [Galerina marginata CBS 339.88]
MGHTSTEQPNHEGKDKAPAKSTVSISHPHLPSHATRLPMEILAIIFWMVVAGYQDYYHRPNESWDEVLGVARTVLHASQVCRFWRFAALDCKALWGTLINIDFSGAQWVAELLRRSNPAPLVVQSTSVIRMDPSQQFTSQKWTGVLANAHRFKILHVAFEDSNGISPLLHTLSQRAPLLEYFRLETDEEFVPDDPGHEVDLELPLFAGYAPKLRCLIITHTVMWPFIDFSSFKLVHLDLTHEATIGLQLPISSWLNILAQQPLLETLALSGSMFDSPVTGAAAIKVREVSLPVLHSIKLDGDSLYCGSFFANLILPSHCQVYLDLWQRTATTSVDDLVRGMAHFMRNWEAIETEDTLWKVGTVDGHSFTLTIDIGRVEEDDCCPQLTLAYHGKEALVSPFADLLESLPGLPFMQRDTTFSLNIFGLDDASARSVISFLSSFNKVSQIVLDGQYLDHSLVRLLQLQPTPRWDEGNGLAGNGVLFPALKYVTLDGQNDNSAGLRVFYDYLKWRHDIGKTVHATIYVYSPGTFRNLELCFSHSVTIRRHNSDIDRSFFFPYCTTCSWHPAI